VEQLTAPVQKTRQRQLLKLSLVQNLGQPLLQGRRALFILRNNYDQMDLIFWQCLFCRQNADGNGLAGAIVLPVQILAETK